MVKWELRICDADALDYARRGYIPASMWSEIFEDYPNVELPSDSLTLSDIGEMFPLGDQRKIHLKIDKLFAEKKESVADMFRKNYTDISAESIDNYLSQSVSVKGEDLDKAKQILSDIGGYDHYVLEGEIRGIVYLDSAVHDCDDYAGVFRMTFNNEVPDDKLEEIIKELKKS